MEILMLAWAANPDPLTGHRAGYAGTGYDLVQAHLCAGLRRLGHQARPLIFRRLPRLSALVREVRRSPADRLLVRACRPDHGAVAALTAEDFDLLRIDWEALPRYPAREPAVLPAAPVRTLAELADLLAEPKLLAAVGPASPWEQAVLPAAQATRVGVLVDDLAGEPGTPRDPEAVVGELRWLASRLGTGRTVPLVGRSAGGPAGDLWQLLEAAGGPLPLRAELDSAAITEGTCRAMRRAGVVELAVRVRLGDPEAVKVRQRLAVAAGHFPRVGTVVEPAGTSWQPADGNSLEALAAVAPSLAIRSASGEPPPVAVFAAGPAVRRSRLARQLRQRTEADELALARVLAGRYSGPAAELVDIWWACADPPAEHARWLNRVAGAGTTLWLADPTHWQEPVPFLGRVRPARLAAAPPPDADPPDGVALPLLGYCDGRARVALSPAGLCLEEPGEPPSGGSAAPPPWLADADAARREGTFPAGFLNPMTVLRDAAVWAAAGRPLPPRRLVVGREGAVAASFRGQPVACLRDDPEKLQAALRDPEVGRDQSVAELVRERPWLPEYFAARDAVRAVVGSRPDRLVPAAWQGTRVAGFGAPLTGPAGAELPAVARSSDQSPVVCLLANRSGYHLYGAGPGRAFSLNATAAVVAEVLLGSPDPVATLAAWTGREAGRLAKVVAAMERTLQELREGAQVR